MKKYFYFSVLLTISLSAPAQNAQDIIDTLKKDLKTNPDAKKTATIYSDLTWYYSTVSIDSALHYGKKAVVESTKLGDSTLIAQVYSDVGAVYFRKGNFEKSKENYLTAYTIRKLRGDYNGMAKININLASIYTSKLQYEQALKAYLAAIEYFEKTNDLLIVNTTKANVGLLFFELKNYPKAIKYTNESIEYQEKNKITDKLCTSYVTMGNSYLMMNDTLSALKFYNKSLILCKQAGNKTAIASVYNNLGTLKTAQNKSKEAMLLFNKSAQVRDELNSDLDKASLQLNIAKEYTKAKQYEEAQEVLLKIKKIFEDKKSNDNLLLTYNQLIPVYAHLNQPDSVTFYAEKYTNLKDEILDSTILKQTAELETKYQTAKKEKLLQQKEAEAKQKNMMLVGISFLAFFIALIGFLIYRQQKLKTAQQEKEFELKSAISKIENQNKLQEQRLSISRDLHDNIGAQLTFIISSVDNIKYAFEIMNEKLDHKLSNISSFAKETIVELRDTIWAMNSNKISFEDLEIRINNYIEKAKEAKDQISFSFAIDPVLKNQKLSSVQGMNIYRTIQEAVNNAIKYANASIISINAKKSNDLTKITIQDNGLGFDQTTIQKGNGLQNMQKRIEEIGGKFSIESSNEGTKIEILL